MRKLILIPALFCLLSATAQDLNWNTASYTTGSLSANLGSTGNPASVITLNVTGNTNRLDANFPVKYAANPSGNANDCAANCAIRSSVTFTSLSETVVYTFSFSPAVTGLSFRIYDIDGTDASSGDQAIVTAANGSAAQNITMTTTSGPSISGSGTATATARGTQGNTTDDFINVSITSGVTRVSVIYSNNPNNGSAGNRSFSIGNMSWSGVLPVKWISFSGQLNSSGSVALKWITANEINALKYTVEKSKDGQHFTDIGEQPASGNSNTSSYYFTDMTPGAGNTFYRVRQTDIDAKFDYSGIVIIRPKNGLQKEFVFPNPAGDYLNISLPGNVQLKQVKVYDATGRVVIDAGNVSNRLDISRLDNGLYSLRAENSLGELFRCSFIKQ